MKYLIGDIINEIRIIKKITIDELSNKTNISKSSLYSIESGKRKPSFEVIKTISEALNYPVYLLMLKALKGNEKAENYATLIETLEANKLTTTN